MNRQQLKLAILAWLHRASLRTPVANDFDATAGFIALCEQDMNERLRARCMVFRGSATIDGQYTTLPCDFLEMEDCRLAGGGPPITYVTRTDAANAYWNKTTNNPGINNLAGMGPDFMPILNPPAYPWNDGTPLHCTIIGSEIEWSPFPSFDPNTNPMPEGYQFPVAEMAYFQRLNLGMEDEATNTVLETYPGLYIYGSLIHAAPFLRDDNRVVIWQRQFEMALQGANDEYARAKVGRGPIRQTFRRLA